MCVYVTELCNNLNWFKLQIKKACQVSVDVAYVINVCVMLERIGSKVCNILFIIFLFLFLYI